MKNTLIVHPRVWLEVSEEKILHNFNQVRKFVNPLKVLAVLKADAYGAGVEAMATRLAAAGVDAIGVAELSRACAIKHLGVPIHILGALIDEEVPMLVREGFIAPISDYRIAEILSKEAQSQGKTALCQFKIDSGMGRLGILIDEALPIIERVSKLPGLKIAGIYSHFPSAYSDRDFSNRQVAAFSKLIRDCAERGISFEMMHIANSDGIHNIPEALEPPYTMVRTGINLYGEYDIQGGRAFDLEPVLELKARLVAVRTLPAGWTIGYGRTYELSSPVSVGTVAIGYADGVPFGISGKGSFLLRGKACPVIGRVSMDFTTISLEDVPDAQVGDTVTCLGKGIKVSEWAQYKNCTTYEVICSFGSRVARVFV